MKQNALSIDFKDAHASGNEYSFDYNIMASIVAATEISIQSFMGKSSIPACFDRVNNRLYPISLDGYFTVGVYSLTFNATANTGERVSAIESYLSTAVVYRTVSGNPAVFSDGTATNLKALSITFTPTQSGSGDPSSENIRPISGVSPVLVSRAGKSMLGGVNLANAMLALKPNSTNPNALSWNATTRTISVTGAFAAGKSFSAAMDFSSGLTFKANTQYTFAIRGRGTGETSVYTNLSFVYTDGSNEDILFTAPQTEETLIAVSASGKNLRRITFVNRSAQAVYLNMEQCAIFEGTLTASELEFPLDVEISTGDAETVYGGTLNVITGALTVTWANIASYDDETLPGLWISDRDVYAAGTTPTAGAQVVYELAEPIAYTLTSEQLAALAGRNSVSTNGDSVYLEYLSSGPSWSSD